MPIREPERARTQRSWLASVHILVVLCLGLSACGMRTPVPDSVALAKLGPSGPLLPLYKGLYGLETRTQTAPVVILQIGDSHTANDSFSGRLRDKFQARFGDAGRGTLHPGVPFNHYRPERVAATSNGWTLMRAGRAAGPMGIAALRQHAEGPADMTLSSPDPTDQTNVLLEFLAQPGGGSVDIVSATGWKTRISTNARTVGAQWVELPRGAGGGEISVSAVGDAPVDMLSWTAQRDRPGVIVANLGTIGAMVDLILQMDPALLKQELDRLSPTAIFVAFGTNEAFGAGTEAADYRARFEAAIHMLRTAAPSAAIVVIGPPDSGKRAGGGGVTRVAGPVVTRGKGRNARTVQTFRTVRSGPPAHYDAPPRLTLVHDIQKEVAARENLFFWDWQAAMGGPGSMAGYVAAHPPLAAPDHVHMFLPGYRIGADALFDALMEGYETYRRLGSNS